MKLKLKRMLLFCCLFTLILCGAFASGQSESGQSNGKGEVGIDRDLRLSLAVADDHIITQSLKSAVAEIKDKTGLNIKIYSSSSLGAELETMDMVREGSIDFWCGGLQTLMNTDIASPLSGTLFAFTFDNNDIAERFHEEYLLPEVLNSKEYEDALNLHFISIYNQGARQLTTTSKEVHSPADLKGIKVRSMEQPIAIATVKGLGANPVPIAFNELYLALQTGVAGGQENPYNNIEAMKFYEVQKFLMKTSHQYTFTPLAVNSDVWNLFTVDEKKVLIDVFTKWQEDCNKKSIDMLGAEEKLFIESGVTIIQQEDLDFEAFRKNANMVIEEEFGDEKYESWKEMHDIALRWSQENL